MKEMLLICCGLALAIALQAQIIRVPADYPTIQKGINAASSGDTVLVAEGTYYEQINFKGKKPLVVASQFLMDGNTSHIDKTIIDGSQITKIDSASVVYFISGEDTTSILCGFTITRGKGTQSIAGGNTFRSGGGVFLDVSGAKIIYNYFKENHLNDTLPGNAQVVYGAGLDCGTTMEVHWVVIDNNVINNNSCFSRGVQSGGAGFTVWYNSRITNNTISNNICTSKGNASVFGGGFACAPAGTLPVTSIFQHNIIKNNLAESQNNFAGGAGGGFQEVTGIFSDNEVNGNQAFCGTTSEGTSGVLIYAPKDGSISRNNTFRENSGSTYGGLYMETYGNFNTNRVLVENNYFYDNVAKKGGAFTTHDVPVKLQNNVFSGNHSERGGAICLERGINTNVIHLATLINNSFSRNTASYGGAIASTDSKPLIINSVFWGDSADYGREIYMFGNDKVEIANSIINDSLITGTFIDGGSILNQDPLFTDSVLLTTKSCSPCIDAGIVSYTCSHNETIFAPALDKTGIPRPLESKYDIGAYELEFSGDGIPEIQTNMPYAAWPNPFTSIINFNYTIEESSLVTLRVFDSYGRLVAEPVNEFQLIGEHKVTWNSEGLTAGIYYSRLQAGEQISSVKIIKMK